jgi:hypothetical protein
MFRGQYQNRAIEAAAVIEELIQLAKQMCEAVLQQAELHCADWAG